MLLPLLFLLAPGPPPPPPGPPAFMRMNGLPLSCFGGLRKKTDPPQTVWVAELDLALNLNMQVAKRQCGKGRFTVRGGTSFAFECDGETIRMRDRFQPANRADWKRYQGYLG